MDDLAGARVGLLAHRLAVPPEMAQAAVDAEGVREKKRRALPAVLIVYLNLALWVFPDQGMRACLRQLAAGRAGCDVADLFTARRADGRPWQPVAGTAGVRGGWHRGEGP